MRDIRVITALVEHYGSHTALAKTLGISLPVLSNWKKKGIAAGWRPTMWAILEECRPEVAAELDRDVFLRVVLRPLPERDSSPELTERDLPGPGLAA